MTEPSSGTCLIRVTAVIVSKCVLMVWHSESGTASSVVVQGGIYLCITETANLFADWCTDLHQRLPITRGARHPTCSSRLSLHVCETRIRIVTLCLLVNSY